MSYTESINAFASGQKNIPSSEINQNFNTLWQTIRLSTSNDAESAGGGGGIFLSQVASGTAAVLDSSIDWRDRLITITAFMQQDASPENYLPGGANDDTIGGLVDHSGSGTTPKISSFATGVLYTQAGGDGSASPFINLRPGTSADSVVFWADSSTGALKFKHLGGGDDIAVNALIIYSPDQGKY